ncbi:ImmA/IrrE family metallo-endopeptidase [Vibrio europaeus]|uniref:ImmA/IrrE family metallo-endopeptidase n=1 Tax=Vibrio europaeus TaxID=300876 RepID=UPI00233E60E1|nr:ImmA/IrrE family metallo-endopeptidase [Vibrio europaeus]MDC5869874.1 ImmA/IrrE family metallo-endopeptidase [Vibrio europaeus]
MKLSREWHSLKEDERSLILSFHQTLPVKIGTLAKALGINIKVATLPDNISGEIKETNGSVTIKVNKHDVNARQRFTLAHEVAHFLLHKHLLNSGITDDVLYRSSLSDEVEAQANRLAADILMPLSLIKSAVERHVDKKSEAKWEAVAQEAEVSTTALKIRLGKKV